MDSHILDAIKQLLHRMEHHLAPESSENDGTIQQLMDEHGEFIKSLKHNDMGHHDGHWEMSEETVEALRVHILNKL